MLPWASWAPAKNRGQSARSDRPGPRGNTAKWRLQNNLAHTPLFGPDQIRISRLKVKKIRLTIFYN
jgi:hypothetical protein